MTITINWQCVTWWVAVFWFSYYMPTLNAAPPALTLEVTPQVVNLGGETRIRVRVAPNAENRTLCLSWGKADEDIRSLSCETLDGANARVTHEYWRRLREPGVWTFGAYIVTSDEKLHFTVPVDVTVVGGF